MTKPIESLEGDDRTAFKDAIEPILSEVLADNGYATLAEMTGAVDQIASDAAAVDLAKAAAQTAQAGAADSAAAADADRAQTGLDRTATDAAAAAALAAQTDIVGRIGNFRVITFANEVYSAAITDDSGLLLGLIERATGKWKLALTTDSILPSQKGLMQIYDIDPTTNGGWIFPIVDQAGVLLGGWKSDGSFVANLNAASLLPRSAPGMLPTSVDVSAIDDTASGWLLPIIDSTGKLLGGWKKDGTLVAVLAPESVLPSGTTLQTIKDTFAASKMGLPSGRLYASGDSMSVASGQGPNSYPAQMSAVLGLPLYSSAIGGTRSESIMVRQGGIPMLLTITGNTLPADTSEVDVTAYSAEWVSNNQGSQSITGLLAGQPVVLTHYLDGSNATLKYTVKRQAAAGSSTAVPPQTRFDGDPYQGNELDYHYIWAGRNDDKTTRAGRVAVRDNILRGIDRIKHDRFGIISICPTSVETIGTTDRGYLDETNQLILDAVGAHHWANMIGYMTSRGALDDAGLTPTSQDLIDLANGIVPGSLRADQVHFNSAYGYPLAGNFMARWHRGHGWATGTLTL